MASQQQQTGARIDKNPSPLICDPRLLPLYNPSIRDPLLPRYLSISGEGEPFRSESTCTGAWVKGMALLLNPVFQLNQARFVLISAVLLWKSRGSPGWACGGGGGWLTGRARPQSVLSRQIEQPLAEQSVVLFQVLYQVGLLLHHFLQIGTLSVMKKNTFELCSIAGSTSN